MNILAIQTGIFGEHSNSTLLVKKIVAQLVQQHPQAAVVTRDLTSDPLPYFDAKVAMALNSPAADRSEEQQSVIDLSNRLIEEVKAADAIVIGLPMYNFGIPAQMKSWLDLLARAGTTFKYTEQGPIGLLENKPVYVAAARGGVHQGKVSDSQSPFITSIFGFLGLTDVRIVYAEGLNMGEEAKAASILQFQTNIAQIA